MVDLSWMDTLSELWACALQLREAGDTLASELLCKRASEFLASL